MSEPFFFHDLAYVFTAAIVGGVLAFLTRQPLVVGYVLGGILISPFTPGPSVSGVHTFEVFAEIGESDLAHDTLARVLPLRDTFVAMFLVTMGLLIDPRILRANLGLLAVIVGLTVLGKLAMWSAVVWLFRQGLTTAVRVGLGLGQIGEFSFVLVQAARAAGRVGADVYNATLAASVLTILLNALLVRGVGGWLRRPAEAGA